MLAQVAGIYVHAYCKVTFVAGPKGPAETMASTVMVGSFLDVFDHKGWSTHKYIPADKLTQDLGEPKGAGVYGSVLMADGSHVLATCKGPLAYWSGKPEDKAEWIKIRDNPIA